MTEERGRVSTDEPRIRVSMDAQRRRRLSTSERPPRPKPQPQDDSEESSSDEEDETDSDSSSDSDTEEEEDEGQARREEAVTRQLAEVFPLADSGVMLGTLSPPSLTDSSGLRKRGVSFDSKRTKKRGKRKRHKNSRRGKSMQLKRKEAKNDRIGNSDSALRKAKSLDLSREALEGFLSFLFFLMLSTLFENF